MVSMNSREFLHQVSELVRVQLPQQLRDFQVIAHRGGLTKLHYGKPWVHYEVWLQRRNGQVELGLHFEGDAGENSRHLERLTRRFGEIRSALGDGVEPEQWTRSWTRVHETLPLQGLDEPFLMEVSARLAQFIRVLQPMVSREED